MSMQSEHLYLKRLVLVAYLWRRQSEVIFLNMTQESIGYAWQTVTKLGVHGKSLYW